MHQILLNSRGDEFLKKFVFTQLRLCANAEISVDYLYTFLAPIVWELDNIQDDRLSQVVYDAELLIAEYDAGHRTIEDFRNAIASLCAFGEYQASATNSVIISVPVLARE